MNERIGPPRIVVIAPSGAVVSRETFDAGLERLRALGCEVHSCVPAIPWLRFADTDAGRLAQIHDAARARDVDLVMIARGGYGLTRLLDRIDWPLVADSVQRGVRWVGFSDFTAFQTALLARTGLPSWAGPTVCADFGQGEPDPYMLEQFRCLLDGVAPVVEWAEPPGGEALVRAETRGGSRLPVAIEGTLWGGNLAMLASLTGTRWLPEVEAGLLFVEDVSEHPYRIERMLLQLLHAGILASQRAVLFGAFTGWSAAPHDNGYGIDSVADHLAERLEVPIVMGLPFGHVRRRAVLGVGRPYRLETLRAVDRESEGERRWSLEPVRATT